MTRRARIAACLVLSLVAAAAVAVSYGPWGPSRPSIPSSDAPPAAPPSAAPAPEAPHATLAGAPPASIAAKPDDLLPIRVRLAVDGGGGPEAIVSFTDDDRSFSRTTVVRLRAGATTDVLVSRDVRWVHLVPAEDPARLDLHYDALRMAIDPASGPDLRLVLSRARTTLRARVEDEEGRPVAGARLLLDVRSAAGGFVELESAREIETSPAPDVAAWIRTTDEEGIADWGPVRDGASLLVEAVVIVGAPPRDVRSPERTRWERIASRVLGTHEAPERRVVFRARRSVPVPRTPEYDPAAARLWILVVDSEGRPVPGARIRVTTVGPGRDGDPVEVTLPLAEADSQGFWSAEGTAGDWTVRAWPPDADPDVTSPAIEMPVTTTEGMKRPYVLRLP